MCKIAQNYRDLIQKIFSEKNIAVIECNKIKTNDNEKLFFPTVPSSSKKTSWLLKKLAE